MPRAMVYGLLRALPGDQACLTPSPALLLADLTPASGRQNDTTWPYAAAPFVKGTTASTASRPALMTLRNAPLWDGTKSLSCSFAHAVHPKFATSPTASTPRTP